jgi:streptomycin 6-kinase
MSSIEGNGAVRVLEIDGPALLLERPQGNQSLVEMSKEGLDDEATRILWRDSRAYAGLSGAWCLEDRQDATLPLAVAQIASTAVIDR